MVEENVEKKAYFRTHAKRFYDANREKILARKRVYYKEKIKPKREARKVVPVVNEEFENPL